ncbi:MFS transporter [Lactobacillaceae bacterium L1_55_11]|nr:MFS transporter [Lactobacillaceae bacterium L1_55_11]
MNQSKQGGARQWLALFALSLGVFMGLLDVGIVNVALPDMVKSFNTTFTNVQWVVSAYTMSYAVVILVVAKLGDMYGRKKMFLISMAIFVLASAVNGLAPNILVLDLSRAVQAMGGAGLMTLPMALVASVFDGKQRGTALGILGSVMGVSMVVAPLIGGVLVQAFAWPAIFYVNVPIGIFAAILVWFTVSETPSYGEGQRIDWWGMILSAVAIFAAVYGLIQKEENPHWSWTQPQIAAWLSLALVTLIIFIWVEAKIDKPMMNLTVFKNKNFVGAVVVAFALGSAIYANNIFLTSLMQSFMGYSAFETGLRQLPLTFWSLILGPMTGYLGRKFGSRNLISGSLLVSGVAFLLFMNAMTTHLTYDQLILPLVVLGIANGLINPLLNNAGLAGAAPAEIGMVSGLINVFRQLGISFGVVILGLVQTNHYDSYLNHHFTFTGIPAGQVTAIRQALIEAGPFAGHSVITSPALLRLPLAKTLQNVVSQAFYNSLWHLTLASLIIVVIAAGLSFALLMGRQQGAKQD